jgi:hypothetical protein
MNPLCLPPLRDSFRPTGGPRLTGSLRVRIEELRQVAATWPERRLLAHVDSGLPTNRETTRRASGKNIERNRGLSSFTSIPHC